MTLLGTLATIGCFGMVAFGIFPVRDLNTYYDLVVKISLKSAQSLYRSAKEQRQMSSLMQLSRIGCGNSPPLDDVLWLITLILLFCHPRCYSMHPHMGLFFPRSYSLNTLLWLKMSIYPSGNSIGACLPVFLGF